MGLVDTVKSWMSFDEEDYENEEVGETEATNHNESKVGFNRKSKVVSMPGVNPMKIMIMKPANFEATNQIADELKARRPVVIDVGNLDAEVARRVVDFISGTVCGINGNIQRVSGGIFVATPSNVDVMGQIKSDFSINKGYTY